MNAQNFKGWVAAAAVVGALIGFGAARVYDPSRDAAVVEAEQLRSRLNQFGTSLKTIVDDGNAQARAIDAKIKAAHLPTE